MTDKIYIFIVRHGHACSEGRRDFDRQLNEKGRKNVKKAALFINKKCNELEITPQLCISSAAIRTKQTSEILHQYCTIEKTHYYQELYVALVSQWLEKIVKQPQQNIVIVGHNPTFSQMINNFCGQQIYMKPANCALIQLEINPDGIIYPATLIDFHNND